MTAAGTGTAAAGTTATATAGTTAAGAAGAGTAAVGGAKPATAGTAAPVGAAGTGTGVAGATTGAAGTAAGSGGAVATAGASAAAGAGGGAAAAGTGAGGAPAMGMGTLGGPLKYTSALMMGMTIPALNKCPMPVLGGGMGMNKSPAISWTGGPADTKSFAIVLFDTGFSMLHWVLWDIPATVNQLPEGLASGYELMTPMGAHQATSSSMSPDNLHQYFGPCSSGMYGSTYEYRLYALKEAKLTLTEMSTAQQAQAAVEAAKLEMVAWSGKPE